MKTRYLNNPVIMILLAAFMPLVSCSDSVDPFIGVDNYITSFSLVKDGVEYQASIAGDEIVMTAPENIFLDNATAKVQVSENATIYPDPSEIRDWDNDQMFIVTSLNGTDRSYKYTVRRSGKAYVGSVSLNSQADVDAFAANDYNIILGSLNIGESIIDDPINSLRGLVCLQEISANLRIGGTFTLDNLAGLDNLRSVGALIVPSSAESLMEITLPKLETIKSNVTLEGPNVFTVSLPHLKKIGGSLSATVPVKTFDMSALQEIDGDLTYAVTTEGVMTSLTFQQLRKIGGTLTLQPAMNVRDGALSTLDVPMLESCSSFIIQNIPSFNIIYAPRLREISADYNLGDNKYIETNFSSLKKVGTWNVPSSTTDLDVRGIEVNNLIIDALGSEPKTITGDGSFSGNIEILGAYFQKAPSLTLKGFTIIGSLTLGNFLRTYAFSMPDTKIIAGNVDISSANRFTNECFPFPVLEEVGGDFKAGTWQSWNDATFEMATLKKVGGDFSIGFSGTKVTTVKLPALENVGGNFQLLTSQKVGEIELTALKEVGGVLSVMPTASGSTTNSALANLNGFSNLEKVGGITIARHSALTSFAGIKNTLPSLTEENWKVELNGYNPTFEDIQSGKWDL